ncbi:MAG: tol-pal system protein YbgF [Sphingomonadaceae bacterium]
MRILAMILVLVLASSATAQGVSVATADQMRGVERRVTTLESQMRAVQRQVFPGGDRRFFAAEEVPSPEPAQAEPEAAAPSALFELAQRVDRLEAQQRELTGQIEELQFRLRQLQQNFERAKADSEFRLDTLEGKTPAAGPAAAPSAAPSSAASPAAPAAAPSPEPAPPAASAAAPAADPEARYLAAYRLYEQRDFARAHAELAAFARDNPKHPRASNAQYWAGRSLMQLNQPAEAAKLFLTGYQTWPKGQRAAESLLWLGRALTDMKQPKAACQALDQLRTAYPERLTGALAAENGRARAAAGCGA